MKRSILIFAFIANLLGELWGLDPQKKITQYTLNTWKTERGLPNNSVWAIVQDHSGYLWLGTAEGLVRFDGVNFKAFNSKNTAEFHDNYVLRLYVDRQGTLWIGTMLGELLSLEQGRFSPHRLTANVSGRSNYCMAENGHGDLWVGTTEGLFCRSFADKELFKKYNAFPGLKIRSLAIDGSDSLADKHH